MNKFSALGLLIMILISFGCNNPKGGSTIAQDHTPLLLPPAAFSFSQIRAADGDIRIVWQSSVRAETYSFFMGTDPASITTPVPACSNTRTSCQLTGLNVNTLYYFNVIATNAAGTKAVNSTGRALSVDTTGFDITNSTAANGSVTYTWTPAAANTTSYNLIYGTSSGQLTSVKTNVVSPYTLTGLTNGDTYYARIVAVNADNGYGLSPSEVSDQPVGPLPAPTGLVATATPNVTTLDWADRSGAISYEIWDSAGTTMYGTSATSAFTHTHNSNGTTYTYKVRAINAVSAPGTYSAVVSSQSIATFNMTTAVSGPLPGQATVTWPTSVTGAATYNIRYGSNPAALNQQVTNVTSPYTFPSLAGGLTYYFRVNAVNAVGAGATQPSDNQLSATPVAPIAPPTGVVATASASGINLTWNAVPGATEYRVYRNTASGSHVFRANTLTATNFFDNTATANGSTYFYVVRSFNGLESANSTEVSKLPIANFTLTSATVATFSSVDLTWAAATGASGYDILWGTSPGVYGAPSLNRTSPTTLTGLTASTTYYVAIRAKNTVGGGSTTLSNELTFTTGTLYPTVTIGAQPLINNANKAAYNVAGTCSENGRNVSVNIGGVTSSVACASNTWSLTMNVTAAADSASRSIVATHTNSGNNSDTDTVNVIKDTADPTVVITGYPAINAANEAAYTVSGTCSENTRTVNVSVGGSTATPTCTGTAWSATLDVSGLSDSASISITANMSDAAGNTGSAVARTVSKDTVAASVAISSAPTINNANRTAYPVSGTCSETGNTVTVKVGAVTATVNCNLLSWSASMNVTSVADAGAVVVTADHVDDAGNAATQASTLVVKDTVNPSIAITSAPDIISTNESSYTVSGTCSEDTRNVVVNVGALSSTVTCSSPSWSATFDTSSLADAASVTVTATHTDSALNSATVNDTVVKQTALPTVTISSSTPINNTNKAAYPVNGTCSHNTRPVTVNVGGVTATPTCTTGAWSASVNVTAVADNAAVVITADHVDSVGNAAVQATTNVLKDVVIPTVAITSSPAINNTNKAAYTVSGTCSENTRTVTVSVSGVSATPSCSGNAWSATVDASAVADGASRTITANHTDAANNAAVTASVNVAKDTVAPAVAITSYPVINNNNKAAYVVSGTCNEATRTVNVSVGGVTGTPTCSGTTWTSTLDVTSVGDGSVTITANISDAAGNMTNATSRTVLKDTAIPTVAISTSPVVNNANKNAYPVTGTCSDSGESVVVNVGATSATVTCTLLTWSASLNVSANADTSTLIVTADHTDDAGNSAVQAGTSVVKDTANPTVTIASAPSITNSNKNAYPVSGTCSENTRTVTVSVGGIPATPACSGTTWSTSLDVNSLSDSSAVAVTANHNDSAGNNATQASVNVIKQTALPTVTIASYPIINNTNKAAYTVSGTCSETGRAVNISIGGLLSSPNCSGTSWTLTRDVSSLVDSGSISITADHTDSVGNNAVQATRSVVKDTIIPMVSITSAPTINGANKAAYTVSGNCSEDGRSVSVVVGGASGTPTCSSGAWSLTLDVTVGADNASVSVTANHTDAANNAATTASTTVIKDTTSPTVAISTPAVINNANKAAYTVSGTCNENGRTVTVSVGGVTGTPTCNTTTWTTTLDVTAVPDSGAVAFTANLSDAAGNNATQATASAIKDTGAPTVAISTSTIINAANRTNYSVSGTCSENTRTVSVLIGGTVSASPICSGGTWTAASLNVNGVADNAAVSITANHTDAAGNPATQASTTVLKDTGIPTVAITTPVDAINGTNATAYTVSGTCSETTRTVTVSVGGIIGTPSCSGTSWTTTLNVAGLSDGTITITANHTDAASNAASQFSTTTPKNTNIPTVSINTPVAINNGNQNAYPLSGTCSVSGRPVNVNVGGVTASPNCSGTTWTASLNVSGLTDSGSVAVTANHSDAVGNNAIQASTTVLKDVIIPTVTINAPAAINNGNKTAYTVTGTCSENTRTVSVTVGGVSGSGTCTAPNWSATVNVNGVTDNAAVSITANHTDAALNNATQATSSALKDTTNPTVSITGAVAINNSNQASYPVGGLCSENTRTVSVSVGGRPGTATCNAGSWNTNIDVSMIGDSGTVAILADHTDLAGNNATQATASVAKDTALPTVSITSSPSINNTNKATYTVGGTCSESTRLVTLNVGGVSGTIACSGGGTWSRSLDVTSVSDSASVTVTANHTDVAGNAATQASVTVLKDVVIPTVTITTPVAINNTNKASYPIGGTCSENSRTVTVVVGGVSGTPSCSSGSWSTNLDVSAIGDGGSIAVTANHTDLAGNNATQASTTTSKDTTAPTVAITSTTAINNTNKATYPVSGTCNENGRTVTVTVGGQTPATQPTCSTTTWSTTVDVTSVSDSATVAITANLSDAAGNNATQATANVLKDTVIPTVSITSAPTINNSNRSPYVFGGLCSENGRSVTVAVGANTGSATCLTGSWSASIVVTVPDNASVTITANHTDAALNNATQASTTVLKDTSNPTVTIASAPVINNANKAGYTVSGSCSESTLTVSVSIGGIVSTPTCNTGSWSTTSDVTALSDGTVSVTANHTDAAGNTATQATASPNKDTSNPTVAINALVAINNANKGSYTVTGTCSESGRAVTVVAGGISATPNCGGGNTWTNTFNMTSVPDNAAVSITANHTDLAGNAATQASTTVLKDVVAPTVTIATAPAINNTNKGSYTVTGTCSEDTRAVSVTVGTASGSTSCSTTNWSITLNVTAVADNANVTVTANHSDLAGNPATQASRTTPKDTVDPTVAISTPTPVNDSNKGTYIISGGCSENGLPVSVNVGGVTATPNCSTNAWTATLNLTSVTDNAAVAVTANHSDVNGNAAPQASTTVLKDTVLPNVALNALVAINNSNKGSYTVSGTCSEDTRTVSVSVGSVNGSPACSSGTFTINLNVTALTDNASIAVSATHTDVAGNSRNASTTVAKDTGLPTVAINSPAVINNANKTSYTVSGTCSETGRNVTVNVGSVNTTYMCSLLTWTVTVDISGNPDSGTLLITADHTDAAGNAAVQAGTTVVKDTVNPTIAINTPAVIRVANQATYTVSGTCSENTRTVSISVGSVNSSATCSGGTWTSPSMNVTALADSATVAISATHTDSAANSNTANTTVVKDATNPTLAFTVSPTINIANVTNYTISGTCSENGRTVTLSSGATNVPVTCTAGAWGFTGNVSTFADNTALPVSITMTDAVGNSTTANTTLLKDTVAPTVALSSAAGSPTYAAFVVRATFSETVTGIIAGDFAVTNSATSSFTAVSGTLYDITVTPVADGAVTVNMAASAGVDVAGNPSTAATQLSRTYQTPAVLTFANTSTHDFGTVPVGGSADVTMIINKANVPNATTVTGLAFSDTAFSFKGGAYPGTGGTCTGTITGTCTVVVTYAPGAAGTDNSFVTLQYNNGGGTVTASRAITGVGQVIAPTKIHVTGPAGIMTNQCVAYTIVSQSASGEQTNVTANQTVNLVVNNATGGTNAFYTTNTCGTVATSTIINANTSSRTIWFRSTQTGQNLTLVFNPASLTSDSIDVSTATTGATRIVSTPPAEIETNVCYPVTIDFMDAAGNRVGKNAAVQVNLTENGTMEYFSDSVCTGLITSVNFAANEETKTVYVKNATQQSVTLTMTDNAAALTTDTSTVSFVNALTWWNTAFAKRMPITLNNLDQATAHTNIQVLVKLDSSKIDYADLQSAGQDIRFTLADHTTALSYDIESWSTTGTSYVWVKIPTMAASASMVIYMYYDNGSAADGQSPVNTWTGYSGVWNTDKTGANYYDATNSGKNGVPNGGLTEVDGPNGKALAFNGTNAFINTGTNLATVIGSNATMSFWVRTTSVGNTNFYAAPTVTGIRDDSSSYNEIYFGWLRNTGAIGIQAKNGNSNAISSFVVNDNTWRYVTMTRNSGTGQIRFFVNGIANGTGTSGTGAVTSAFTSIGVRIVASGTSQPTVYFDGDLDSIRMYNSVITDARIRAEYKFAAETNISYGTVENL